MTSQPPYDPKLSYLEASRSISVLGIKKANTQPWQLFLLAILAGLYIALGGHVYLVAIAEGLGRIVGGAVFGVGLVLVVVAGAELFTGNIIMIVAAMSSLVRIGRLLRNWVIVYLGNFVGSFLVALLIYQSGLLGSAGSPNALGQLASKVAEGKIAQSFGEAFLRGVFCNILVIMAIILATISKDVISKIVCCVLPIMTFVACGFEHCVANMFLIPLGLLAKGTSLGGQYVMFRNILPVTLGNIVGGLAILLIHPNRIRQLIVLASGRASLHKAQPQKAEQEFREV
ncbi:MAG: putative formate transporter 1 [Planctomycetes bacterium ADurb.Bin126]|nr:MAG: putative formate transporter 1 [Planctomycetes bacterium ADurb.Bin126]HOD79801.1 formate/nitrite transporter family protein [Phycisphaerae bacterium]HQL72809.1 formate/nitrite transporter family protein [Phycisphaerae bacterium]